jgi:acetyl esterase/lipase
LDLAIRAIEISQNYGSDYVTSGLLKWALRAFKPDSIEATDPCLSLLNNEFGAGVPTFIHTGTAEALHDDHRAFVKNMKKIQDNEVELVDTSNATHDIFAAGQIFDSTKEAEVASESFLGF